MIELRYIQIELPPQPTDRFYTDNKGNHYKRYSTKLQYRQKAKIYHDWTEWMDVPTITDSPDSTQ